MQLGCEPTSACLRKTTLVENTMLVYIREKPEQFGIPYMVMFIRAVLGIIVKSVASELRVENLSFTGKDWMLLRSGLPALCTSLPNLFSHVSVLLHMWFLPLSREYPVSYPLISKKSAEASTLWENLS
ncbi:hypothetical protein HJG60_007833 [Phyllostomus discolor]|uniref:Uncharacterized protein n=1 Tax=Phyllostomus discolor TaxID=89673 RepID=A0A834BHD7_9CHIR|nr:hypothetical protein HJG60_007833 [Phyllostomus discolor]